MTAGRIVYANGARLFCYAPVKLPVILLPYFPVVLAILPAVLPVILPAVLPVILPSIHPYPTCYPAISIFPSWSNRYSFPSTNAGSHGHLPVCSQVIERTIFPVPSGPHVSVTVKRVPYAVNLLPASNHTGSVLADIVPVCPILMPARST